MKVLLLVSFVSTLLITFCTGNPSEDYVSKCKYPSGCFQPRDQISKCISTTRPYAYDSATKTCRIHPRVGCGQNTCNYFSSLLECRQKCPAI
uniref:BPTI/Kunitz inhibitor domain-containing protein n=1 Tax=Rhipicephalus appendiculatus TaxID=34631 RepID=A0A131Z3G2_RHIAP